MGIQLEARRTLAAALPLQIIDPDVHNLVSGGPDERRRYLDWIAFHVEQGYLDAWRRYRRTLKTAQCGAEGGAVAAKHQWLGRGASGAGRARR